MNKHKIAMVTAGAERFPAGTVEAIREFSEIKCKRCETPDELLKEFADYEIFWMFRPDGTTSFLFARNLSAPDGKASFRFRMAHNDSKGVWKLVVTDALTGVSLERKFTVR